MCGIFGIVTKSMRSFDFPTFCTLGIANDSRGGDSCGYFIDGHYEYGAKDDDKWFQCFFQDNKFLNELKMSSVAFGHCRKASVGIIDETTAQPVVLTNANGKVEYVLMHNGTIYNYKELAKKYIPDIDITGMTDSQVMARIFYRSGYKALSEYNGGAVFAIADYRGGKPKILLFKGASKKDKWDKKETDERPLYFCVDPIKGELIFSSIASYLMSLRHKLTTWILNPNCLFEFNGKDLIAIEEASRANACQRKETVYVTPSKYGGKYWGEFGLEESNGNLYDDFISTNQVDNTYHGRGKKLQGRVILSKYGMMMNEVPKKSTYKEIFFWDGVALKNVACFRFLTVLKKDSKLEDKEFNKKFKNLIRYLSVDGVYHEKDVWYRATSPTKRVPFTGTLNMITSTSSTEFFAGSRRTTKYGRTSDEAFSSLEEAKLDVNFKTIKEECKSLMK